MSVQLTLNTQPLDALLRRMDARAADGLADAGEDLENLVKQSITAFGAVDSGDMRDSVDASPVSDAGGTFQVIVSVGAKSERGYAYPIAVHEGHTTRSGGWVAGRPFMRVAVEQFKPYYANNYFGRVFE
jgi:hypothetical protein